MVLELCTPARRDANPPTFASRRRARAQIDERALHIVVRPHQLLVWRACSEEAASTSRVTCLQWFLSETKS